MSDGAKSETGSRVATSQLPSWKSLYRHNSGAHWPICTKFGLLMQNEIPLMTRTSKSKPEIAFQYGGRLFFETGSSNISAVYWDSSLKFRVQIDFNVFRWVTVPNPKPEVDLRRHSRHLENHYGVTTSAPIDRCVQILVRWCRTTCRWRRKHQNRNLKKNYKMTTFGFITEVFMSHRQIEVEKLQI